jgi:outer membrane protein assembly factor BamB
MFWFEIDNQIHLSYNDILPKYKKQYHVNIETKNWLKDHFYISPQKKSKIFYYTFSNTLGSLYSYGALPKGIDQFSIIGTPTVTVIGNKSFVTKSLSKESDWIYNIIKNGIDSLFIYNILKEDSLPSVALTLAQNEWKKTGGIGVLPYLIYQVEKILMNIHLEFSIFSKPIFVNDNSYICTKSGSVICLDKSGDKKWNYETNGSIYSSPLIEKDLIVVATNEGDLFTINKNTGNLYQVIGIGETITSDIALVDIEHNGSKTKGICFGTAEGNFYCYELYSLELIWWNQSAKDWINSSVAAVNGKVIFQDKKGTMYCLNSRSGVLLWKWEVNTKTFHPLFKSDIIVKDNNICFIDFDGDLHCIDALLGTEKWSIRKIKATGKIELNENKNELILHSTKNKILVVSLSKRKVIEEFSLPDNVKDEIATDILSIDNTIFVGFTDGSVYVVKEKFRIIFQGFAPIVSLNKMNGNILVTDYDGNLTLLKLIP